MSDSDKSQYEIDLDALEEARENNLTIDDHKSVMSTGNQEVKIEMSNEASMAHDLIDKLGDIEQRIFSRTMKIGAIAAGLLLFGAGFGYGGSTALIAYLL